MKSTVLFIFLTAIFFKTNGQKVDSIFFHLYTDSLKKGTYNYISIDGKLSNGRWFPLTSKEINFTASAGKFDGNSLFIARDYSGEKITVKAMLKDNSAIVKDTTIYIKKREEDERLKTSDEVLDPAPKARNPKNKNRKNY
jgi:hypothetical protein